MADEWATMPTPVYIHRESTDLKPGMGECIAWMNHETVRICQGPDKGRSFVITSGKGVHSGAPGKTIRDGYFLDDPTKTIYAVPEENLWFHDGLPDPKRHQPDETLYEIYYMYAVDCQWHIGAERYNWADLLIQIKRIFQQRRNHGLSPEWGKFQVRPAYTQDKTMREQSCQC